MVALAIALVASACASSSAGGGEATSTGAPTTTKDATATTTVVPTPATSGAAAKTTTVVDDEAAGLDFIVELATPFVEPGGVAYAYVEVVDNTGGFSVEIPDLWSDVDGSPWADGILGPATEMSVNAAEDLNAFSDGFTAPGILIGPATGFASDAGTVDPVTEWDFSQNCTNEGVFAYRDESADSDGFFTLWSGCSDTDAVMLITAATAPAESTPAYTFESVEDDTGTLVVSVPVTWSDRDTESPGQGDASIAVAPDLNGFNADWAAPGVWVPASRTHQCCSRRRATSITRTIAPTRGSIDSPTTSRPDVSTCGRHVGTPARFSSSSKRTSPVRPCRCSFSSGSRPGPNYRSSSRPSHRSERLARHHENLVFGLSSRTPSM